MAVHDCFYHPHEVNALFEKTDQKCLKFFHLNVRSARSKTDDLFLLFNTFQPMFDIIMLTETWYSDDSDVFLLPGYEHFYLNRKQNRGGGVSILISNTGFEIVSEYSAITDHYEVLCIRKKLEVYCVVYRPPNGNVSQFFEFLERLFSSMTEVKCNFILGGDLNIDFLDLSRNQSELSLLLSAHNLQNVISLPTRITASCSSLLDIFITNHDSSNITAGVMSLDLSDHLPIFMLIHKHNATARTKVNEVQPARYIRSINNKTLQTFRRNVESANWSSIIGIKDINKAYDKFIEVFKSIYTSSFPLRLVRTDRRARKP